MAKKRWFEYDSEKEKRQTKAIKRGITSTGRGIKKGANVAGGKALSAGRTTKEAIKGGAGAVAGGAGAIKDGGVGIVKGGAGLAGRGISAVGRSSVFTPLKVMWDPIIWFLKLFGLALGIFGLIFGTVYIYSGFTRGELAEVVDIRLAEAGIDFKFSEVYSSLRAIARWESSTEPQVDFEGKTDTEESDIGLTINLKSKTDSAYANNKPISATAKIEVGKVSEDINLNIKCSLEDYEDDFIDAIPPDIFLREESEGRIFNARCEFEKGISPEVMKDDKNVRDIKKIKMYTSFNYDQEVSWYPSVFDTSMLSRDNKLPDVIDPTWKVKEGPASLRIGSSETQPFFVGEEGYVLYLTLEKEWQGSIKKVNSIEIITQGDIRLNTESSFCDFTDGQDTFLSGNENIYTLTWDKLDEVNIDCSTDSVREELGRLLGLGSKATYSECVENLKGEFTFECPFEVIYGEGVVSQTKVTAIANYKFEDRKTTGIKVFKEKGGELSEEPEDNDIPFV